MTIDENPTMNEPTEPVEPVKVNADTQQASPVDSVSHEEDPKPVDNSDATEAKTAAADPQTAAEGAADETDPSLEDLKAQAEKLGIPLEQLLALPMTHDDVLFLLEQCPYLQVVNAGAQGLMNSTPKQLNAQSGWIILDYGDAMTASPGRMIFADHKPDPAFLYGSPITEEDKFDEAAKGTIIKQAVDTAAEMVFIAIQRKWPGVAIVEGSDRMKWAAWVMANDHEFPLQGYDPTDEDLAKQKRLRRSRAEIDDICLRNRQTMPAGSQSA